MLHRYVTLGSPHAPPPPGAEGVVDQTRGILNYCQDACPGAHHPEVRVAREQPHLCDVRVAAPVCVLE